jgi:hypothetical protein
VVTWRGRWSSGSGRSSLGGDRIWRHGSGVDSDLIQAMMTTRPERGGGAQRVRGVGTVAVPRRRALWLD